MLKKEGNDEKCKRMQEERIAKTSWKEDDIKEGKKRKKKSGEWYTLQNGSNDWLNRLMDMWTKGNRIREEDSKEKEKVKCRWCRRSVELRKYRKKY